MLAINVQIEPEALFPLDDRQGSIQRVEIGNLDVALFVVLVAVGEGHATSKVIALLRRAGRDPQNAAEHVVGRVDAHSHINKWKAEFL